MSKQVTLKNIEGNLKFFQTMYDIVRLVDPLRKSVLEYSECKVNEKHEECYNYWENGKICDNCISVRAYNSNKSFVKLEYKPETVMMVTAIPMQAEGTTAVLELLKNVTDSIMVGSGDYNEGRLLHNIVSEFNFRIIKDKLTDLYNRYFIDDRLPADIVNAAVSGTPLSVIFLDMDDFKHINDKYGHISGDLVIKEVGNVIKNSIRADTDWAARYGGDEFFICLNNTDYDEAYGIAERIQKEIEKISVSIQGEDICFFTSMGIHTMKDSMITAEELLNIADKKMYEAKKSGKNCIFGNVL